MVHYLAKLEGLNLPRQRCEQISLMCKNHALDQADDTETEVQQQHTMNSFMQCTKGRVGAAAVHVTTKASVLASWMHEIVHSSLLPEAEEMPGTQSD